MKAASLKLPENIRQVPPDEALVLSSMFEPDYVATRLTRDWRDRGQRALACHIGHVRYRPGESCTINYEVKVKDPRGKRIGGTTIYAKLMGDSAYDIFEAKLSGRKSFRDAASHSILRWPDKRAILFEFPIDPRLPHLKLLTSPDELAGHLYRVVDGIVPSDWQPQTKSPVLKILRYKPEQRLVCSCSLLFRDKKTDQLESYDMILRFEPIDRAAGSFKRMRHIAAALGNGSRVQLPAPLFCLPTLGIIGMRFVPGKKLAEILKGEEAEAGLVRVAELLAELHGQNGLKGLAAEHVGPPRRIEEIKSSLAKAGGEIKDKTLLVTNHLLRQLSTTKPTPESVLHGDFHQGQVLLEPDGGWLVDYAGAHRGEAAFDLGNCLAQLSRLHSRGRLNIENDWDQLFIQAYEDKRGLTLCRSRIACFQVLGLLELATREFRRLKIGWPESIVSILKECRTVLD